MSLKTRPTMTSYPESMISVDSTNESSERSLQDNKICQWYCCSCGKSYGTIVYKQVEDRDREELKRALEYYWSLGYHKIDVDIGSSTGNADPISDFWDDNGDNHYHYGTNESEPTSPLQDHKCELPASSGDYNSMKFNYKPHVVLKSENDMDAAKNDDPRHHSLVLNFPTRFTCSRCVHMMCPYCLKIRYKDLY